MTEVAEQDSVVLEVLDFDAEELEEHIFDELGHGGSEEVAVVLQHMPETQHLLVAFIVELATGQDAFVSLVENELGILRVLLNGLLHVEDHEVLPA